MFAEPPPSWPTAHATPSAWAAPATIANTTAVARRPPPWPPSWAGAADTLVAAETLAAAAPPPARPSTPRSPMSTRTPAEAVRRAVDPVRDFPHAEAAGGSVLLAATAVALGWANRAPWPTSTSRSGGGGDRRDRAGGHHRRPQAQGQRRVGPGGSLACRGVAGGARGPQLQRWLRRLHRLLHRHQPSGQPAQVDPLAQPDADRRDRPGSAVAAAIERRSTALFTKRPGRALEQTGSPDTAPIRDGHGRSCVSRRQRRRGGTAAGHRRASGLPGRDRHPHRAGSGARRVIPGARTLMLPVSSKEELLDWS
jgi:hypothetical protein